MQQKVISWEGAATPPPSCSKVAPISITPTPNPLQIVGKVNELIEKHNQLVDELGRWGIIQVKDA